MVKNGFWGIKRVADPGRPKTEDAWKQSKILIPCYDKQYDAQTKRLRLILHVRPPQINSGIYGVRNQKIDTGGGELQNFSLSSFFDPLGIQKVRNQSRFKKNHKEVFVSNVMSLFRYNTLFFHVHV